MPAFEITAANLKAALESIRRHGDPTGSTLESLRAVAGQQARLARIGSPSTPAAALVDLLWEITDRELAAARGGAPSRDTLLTPARAREMLAADFAACDPAREAWSAIYFRYFDPHALRIKEIAAVTQPAGRNAERQVNRRIRRGLFMLAGMLRQAERAAIQAGPGASAPSRTNLPLQVTSFVAREAETATVRELLGAARLVTLTGTGGTGKTRLGLHAAEVAADAYPDGTWFVDLSSLSDGSQLAAAVASALDLQPSPGRTIDELLAEHVRQRRLLLVLDNCEHLVEPCSVLVHRLLDAADHLTILATSREALGIADERTWVVPPLDVPDEGVGADVARMSQYAAVRLFIERARQARSGFAVTNATAPEVAELCRQLDGIPLAIELAAARMDMMSPGQVLARIGDRFHILAGRKHGAVPRHRSLQAALDWSHDLLEQPERVLFRRLAVFHGGWTLEAAEQVCGAPELEGIGEAGTVDALARLVDKSLVNVDADADAAPRFRFLSTVRQYALERLAGCGEARAVRDGHLAHFIAVAEGGAKGLRGAEQARALRGLELDHDNLRAAIRHAIASGNADAALRLTGTMSDFWYRRGHMTEGRHHLEKALALSATPASVEARAKALRGGGTLAFWQGDYSAAERLWDEALAAFRALGDDGSVAAVLRASGNLAHVLGDERRAFELFLASIDILRRLDDPANLASSLNALGTHESDAARYEECAAHLSEALALWQGVGDDLGVARAEHNLALLAYRRGDKTAAIALWEQSLEARRRIGDRAELVRSLANLGAATANMGDFEAARRYHEEALALARDIGDRTMESTELLNLGVVVTLQDDHASAKELFEAALACSRAIDDREGVAYGLTYLGNTARYQGRMEQALGLLRDAVDAWRKIDHPAELAAALQDAALAASAVGQHDAANGMLTESLAMWLGLDNPSSTIAAVQDLGIVAASRGDGERAAMLLAACASLARAAGEQNDPNEQRDVDQATAAARASLPEGDFAAAWAAGEGMTLDEAVALALAPSPDFPTGVSGRP